MSISIKLAKYAHKKLVNYLIKKNNYERFLFPEKDINPVFIIHTGNNINSGGLTHLEQWLTLFTDSKFEFLVIARHIELYEKVKLKYPNINISLVTTSEQAESIFKKFQNLKAVFYLANTGNAMQFIRTYGVKHIFLGHGDSDKSASMNRTFKLYDEIFVSGQAHIDRFDNADFNTQGLIFKKTGRPLHKTTDFEPPKEITQIVYTPTWEGNVNESNYSSLHISLEILKKIREATSLPIKVKLHPTTGLIKKNLCSLESQIKNLNLKNITIISKTKNINNILNKNSIYVCDISSVITEYLTTQCPIITYLPSNQEIRPTPGKLTISDFTYSFKNAQEIPLIIDQIINSNDHLKNARLDALNYYIDIEKTKSNQFEKELTHIAQSVH